jgi:hypothetical protein
MALVVVWVTLLYAVGRGQAGALQALVGSVRRATLLGALEAQQTFAASSITIVHTVNAELAISGQCVSSYGHLDACGTEACGVEPHAMQDHSQLAGHRYHRTAMAADFGQAQAPCFER